MKKLLYKAFENKTDSLYHKVNDMLAIVILIAVGLIIAESVESVGVKYKSFFEVSEWVIVVIFTLEYLLYIYLAKSRTHYLFSFFGIIDFLAIMPTYAGLFLPVLIGFSGLRVLRVVRILRLLRIFRMVKLLRYSRGEKVGQKMTEGVAFTNIEIYFFALFSLVVIAGTLMHLVEGNVGGTAFIDIPAGMWWAIVTLTTVGYGDMVPQTGLGKVIAGVTMVAGLSMFAILISVMGRMMQNVLFGGSVESKE